jgi:hypothetical protein
MGIDQAGHQGVALPSMIFAPDAALAEDVMDATLLPRTTTSVAGPTSPFTTSRTRTFLKDGFDRRRLLGSGWRCEDDQRRTPAGGKS